MVSPEIIVTTLVGIPALGMMGSGVWLLHRAQTARERVMSKDPARAAGPQVAAPPTTGSPTTPRAGTTQWNQLQARLAEATAHWLSYDDPERFLSLPGMRDYSEQLVRDCVLAMETADELDRGRRRLVTDTAVRAFAAAVRDFELTLQGAQQWAQRDITQRMSQKERDSLQTARNLLAQALNNASSPAVRHVAYERVVKIVSDLGLHLPKPAIEHLEHVTRLELDPPAHQDNLTTTSPVDPVGTHNDDDARAQRTATAIISDAATQPVTMRERWVQATVRDAGRAGAFALTAALTRYQEADQGAQIGHAILEDGDLGHQQGQLQETIATLNALTHEHATPPDIRLAATARLTELYELVTLARTAQAALPSSTTTPKA